MFKLETKTYKFTLLGRPRPKKNNQIVTKQRFIIQNVNYKNYEKDCIKQLKIQYHDKPIESRVYVRIKYFLADKREADLFNMDNAISDILQNAKIIANDKQIISAYSVKVAINRTKPRVEILIITGQGELYEEQD